jgi:hypothetical protein
VITTLAGVTDAMANNSQPTPSVGWPAPNWAGGRVCARASEIEVRRNRSRNRLPEAGEGQWQVLGLGTAFDPEELKELQIPASLQQ